MKFAPHGNYRLWLSNKVVFAELSGTWNLEAAINYSEDFKALAQNIEAPWGHFVCFDKWELCSSEVIEITQNLVFWCIEHGLIRAAQVYAPSAIKQQFIQKMVVEELGTFKRAVFDDQAKAVKWLTDQGFIVDLNGLSEH